LETDQNIDPTSQGDALNQYVAHHLLSEALKARRDESRAGVIQKTGEELYIAFFKRQAEREPDNRYWRRRQAEQTLSLANVLGGQSDVAGAQAAARDARAIFQRLVSEDPADLTFLEGVANSYWAEGMALLFQQKGKESWDIFQHAVETRTQLFEKDPTNPRRLRDLAGVLDNVSRVAYSLADRPGADTAFARRLNTIKHLQSLDPAEAGGDYLPTVVRSVSQSGAFKSAAESVVENARKVRDLNEQLYKLSPMPLEASRVVETNIQLGQSIYHANPGSDGVREMRTAFERARDVLLEMKGRGELHEAQQAWIKKLEATLKKLPSGAEPSAQP
jgi:hypothetical protein